MLTIILLSAVGRKRNKNMTNYVFHFRLGFGTMLEKFHVLHSFMGSRSTTDGTLWKSSLFIFQMFRVFI